MLNTYLANRMNILSVSSPFNLYRQFILRRFILIIVIHFLVNQSSIQYKNVYFKSLLVSMYYSKLKIKMLNTIEINSK